MSVVYLVNQYSTEAELTEEWRAAMARHLPEVAFQVWPDEVSDLEQVRYALVWKPDAGVLCRFPNLRFIQSLGAGVDHLRSDGALPQGVPILRMTEDGLTRSVTECALLAVLALHRDLPLYLERQVRQEWVQDTPKIAPMRKVCVFGLGPIGRSVATRLADLGFVVSGWSRTDKQFDSRVRVRHGEETLKAALQESEIALLLLPDTAATRNLFNAERLAWLPRGAYLVNLGRGAILDESALLAALESGQIASAWLDVYHKEPLPQGHAFWSHPRVVMMPHIAGITYVETAAQAVAEQIKRAERGEPLTNYAADSASRTP